MYRHDYVTHGDTIRCRKCGERKNRTACRIRKGSARLPSFLAPVPSAVDRGPRDRTIWPALTIKPRAQLDEGVRETTAELVRDERAAGFGVHRIADRLHLPWRRVLSILRTA